MSPKTLTQDIKKHTINIHKSSQEIQEESERPEKSPDFHFNEKPSESRAKTLSWRSFYSQKTLVVIPTIEGYLKKKATNIFGIWQKRYFVIKDNKLYYYRTDKQDIVSGCIDFSLVSVKIEVRNTIFFFY